MLNYEAKQKNKSSNLSILWNVFLLFWSIISSRCVYSFLSKSVDKKQTNRIKYKPEP